jgi:hypothetical protein
MACFLVPLAEAVVVTVLQKAAKKKERKNQPDVSQKEYNPTAQSERMLRSQHTIAWSRKLGWLSKLLWGGVLLLAIEHIWHGEVVPWPPFLTAMNNPAEIGPMLHEMATIGTGMAVFVTLVWVVLVLVADHKAKSAEMPVKSEF